jgi:hypothetical protein
MPWTAAGVGTTWGGEETTLLMSLMAEYTNGAVVAVVAGRTVYDRLQNATGKVALGELLCYVCLLDHRSYTLEAWYKELIFNI